MWLLVLVCFCSLYEFRSFAQSHPGHNIDSDSVFYITDTFMKAKAKSVLSNLLTHFELKSANQNIGTSPTVQLNQIDLTILPTAYNISDSGSGLSFVATGNTLSVNIGEIAIHDTIQRDVNGVIAIIRVDVSCVGANLVVNDPGSTISSQLNPGVNGDFIQIDFVNPIVSLANPKVKLSGFKCTGAKGLESYISSTIATMLQDKRAANTFLAKLLNENSVLLSNELSFKWNEPRLIFGETNSTKSLQGWVMPNRIALTAENDWQMTGIFRVILPGLVIQSTPYEKFRHWPLDIVTVSGYIAMPDSAFLDLVKSYFAPGQWKYLALANSFKGFSDLLASRFLQFFFWSDLEKYPKDQKFPIKVTTLTAPEVTWVSESKFLLKTTFLVQMMTNDKPYVDFQVGTEAEMEFAVANDLLSLQIKDPKLKVKYKWAATYCDKNCPRIDTNVIAKAIQTYLSSEKFSFKVPPLEFAGTSVHALSLLRNEESQAVVLQLDPN